MADLFAKIFGQIHHSSIAENWQTRLVFMDMLVLATDGVVDMTPQFISRATNVPLDIVTAAIAELEKPDPYSRSKDCDGRRIVRLDPDRAWGWRIVNAEKYRLSATVAMIRMTEADRKAAYRAKYNKKQNPSPCIPSPDKTESKRERENSPGHVPNCPGHVPDMPRTCPMTNGTVPNALSLKQPEKEASFPEAQSPSWNEFWTFCQSLQCGLPAEWYAKDKWLAAEAKRWAGNENWQSYALRCRGWWEQDGRPMTPPSTQKRNGGQSTAQHGPPSRNVGTYNDRPFDPNILKKVI